MPQTVYVNQWLASAFEFILKTAKLSECTSRVQRLEGRKQRQVVHFNRLKPCPKDIRLGHGSGQVFPVNHHRMKDTSSPTNNKQTLLLPTGGIMMKTI